MRVNGFTEEWISVNEKLPIDGETVLVALILDTMGMCFYPIESSYRDNTFIDIKFTPTHWAYRITTASTRLAGTLAN